jgi:flagellar basal body rod protein FlgG
MEQRQIRQNAVEQSGVNELRTLMDMTDASREIDAHVALMQSHDKMMERAINALGRVS